MENNDIIIDTFKWLFIGLLVCFGSSYITTSIPSIWTMVNTKSFIILSVILELILAFSLASLVRKLNPIIAKIMYLVYTTITGMSLSWILLAYTGSSITFIFLATSIIFGVFALIGKAMKVDLTKFGVYLFIALLSVLILEIINIFAMNSTLRMGTCILSILIFAGYVAYDIRFALEKAIDLNTENAGIYCAFQLFIDFISLFIHLLELFGKERD